MTFQPLEKLEKTNERMKTLVQTNTKIYLASSLLLFFSLSHISFTAEQAGAAILEQSSHLKPSRSFLTGVAKKMQHAISLFPSPLSPAEEQPSRQKQIALLLSVASPARHAPQAYTCTQHTLEQAAIAATLSILALSLHCLFFTERKQQQQQPVSSAVSATRKQLSSNSHSSLVLSLSAKRRAAPPSCSRGHAELKLAPSSPSWRCSKAPPPLSGVRHCPTTPDLQELGAASPDRTTSSSPATSAAVRSCCLDESSPC